MPNRVVALILALFGPAGTGHIYMGRRTRALVWLALSSIAPLVAAAVLYWRGEQPHSGGLFLALVAGVIGVFLLSVFDVGLLSNKALPRGSWREVILFGLVGILVAGGIRKYFSKYFVESFAVPSDSMAPTLSRGDHFIVTKANSGHRMPQREEVIVFASSEEAGVDYVKRVIGIANDSIVVEDGHPKINGWSVPFCVVGRGSWGSLTGEIDLEFLSGHEHLIFLDDARPSPAHSGPYKVAADESFVLGDNRNNSFDSRLWRNGAGAGVPHAHVKGPVLFRWVSMSEEQFDWSRSGPSIRAPLLPAFLSGLQPSLDDCLAKRPPRAETFPPPP